MTLEEFRDLISDVSCCVQSVKSAATPEETENELQRLERKIIALSAHRTACWPGNPGKKDYDRAIRVLAIARELIRTK